MPDQSFCGERPSIALWARASTRSPARRSPRHETQSDGRRPAQNGTPGSPPREAHSDGRVTRLKATAAAALPALASAAHVEPRDGPAARGRGRRGRGALGARGPRGAARGGGGAARSRGNEAVGRRGARPLGDGGLFPQRPPFPSARRRTPGGAGGGGGLRAHARRRGATSRRRRARDGARCSSSGSQKIPPILMRRRAVHFLSRCASRRRCAR